MKGPWFVYPFIHWRASESFSLWGITNKAATNLRVQVFAWVCISFSLGYMGVGWLGHMVGTPICETLPSCFLMRLDHVPFLPCGYESPLCSIHLITDSCCGQCSEPVFLLRAEIFSCMYLPNTFFGEEPIQIFWPFFNWLFVFLQLCFESSLCIINTNPLKDLWFTHIFPCVVCLFILFTQCLLKRRMYLFMKFSIYQCIIFQVWFSSFMNQAFDLISKKSLIIYGYKDFSSKFSSRIYIKFYS